jgi:hypothetical protein
MADERTMSRCSNHGSYFYTQLASLYIMVNDTLNARRAIEEYFSVLYMDQINADGEQVRHSNTSSFSELQSLLAIRSFSRTVSMPLFNLFPVVGCDLNDFVFTVPIITERIILPL